MQDPEAVEAAKDKAADAKAATAAAEAEAKEEEEAEKVLVTDLEDEATIETRRKEKEKHLADMAAIEGEYAKLKGRCVCGRLRLRRCRCPPRRRCAVSVPSGCPPLPAATAAAPVPHGGTVWPMGAPAATAAAAAAAAVVALGPLTHLAGCCGSGCPQAVPAASKQGGGVAEACQGGPARQV